MKTRIYSRSLRPVMLLLFLVTAISGAMAQDNAMPERLSTGDAKKAARKISADYKEWSAVEIQGKISLDRMPINPTAKIYMERGREILISMRVPLIGEVAIIDITPSNVTMVNKINKSYCTQPLDSLIDNIPVTINDLQDMFLGRVFLPNSGTLSEKNSGKADFYADDDGWVIIPREVPKEYEVACGYGVDGNGRTQSIYVSAIDESDQAVAEYEYSSKHTTIDIRLRRNFKDFRMELRLDRPNFKPKKMEAMKIPENYKKYSLHQFFKNLSKI